MRNLKKVLFLILFLSYTVHFFAQSVRKMSIENMFELADSSSRSIRTFYLAEMEAEQAVKIEKNALLPSVDLSVSISYLGDVWLSDRNFSNGENASMPHFGNNFSIEASQVVYAGGAVSNKIAMAKLQYQQAQFNREINKQDVRFLLIGNYLEIYKLKNQAEVYRKNIEQTQKLLSDIKAKQGEGLVLRNDITRYELQLKSLELALTQILNSIIIRNNQLIKILGLPEETVIEMDSGLLKMMPQLMDESQWQNLAISESPVLQQASLAIRQSRCNEKLVKSGRLPSVGLFAGDNLDGPITIEVPPINKNLNYWYVGIGLKFDVASIYKSSRDVKLAKLSIQKAEERELLIQDNVRTETKDAFVRFEESFTIYDTQKKSLELAVQNYKIVNNRYLNELALITDMLDASNSKLNAELQLVNAQINILFNYYRLKKATGNL